MEIDIEQIKEEIKRQRENKPKTRFDTYQADLVEYLLSKLEGSNIPASTIMEIALFAMVQTHIVVQDELYRASKEWSRQARRYERDARRSRSDTDVSN